MMKKLLLVFALVLFASYAEAAARFAICNTTCTWDASDTSMWSTTSGGATGASVPGGADTVTLDANTCVGGTTCTITTNTNITVTSITMGACTASTTGCILDLSVNNNNITVATFSGTGTGTRNLKCGSGTWSITGGFDFTTTTNLTQTCGSVALNFNGTSTGATSITFGTSGPYGSMSIGTNTNAVSYSFVTTSQTTSFNNNLTITGPANILIGLASNLSFGGSFTGTGTSTNPIYIATNTSGNSTSTITVGAASTCDWCIFKAIVGATSTITATNSFSLSTNVGDGTIAVTAPTVGGSGGGIIGG